MKPHHLWLLLALQTDRYRDRVPRYYWAELAAWAGVSANTVRRWGYDLESMGLLRIKQNRKLDPAQTRRVGHRNERNEFYLDNFETESLQQHREWKEGRRPSPTKKK
jgi:hypothetical protein